MNARFTKKKLITPEDPNHIHKLLGIFCLGNFVYRWGCFLLYRDMFFYNTFGMVSLCIHGLLSVSSLIFHIPRKRHQGKPMIYPEFRAHSISFGMRHVLSCIMFWFGYNDPLPHYALCFVTMFVGDKISTHFIETSKQTTMRNMPLDSTIDEVTRRENKLSQSVAQLFATMLSSYTINTSFMPLMAIQGASFMMTLVRKNLMTSLNWHQVYNVLLYMCVPYCIEPGVSIHMWLSSVISYFLYTGVFFKYHTNKYMNWLCVFAVHEFCRHNVTYDWGGWCQHIVGITFIVYYIVTSVRSIRQIMWSHY
jgi:hypothetical protein